jgi:hypothetical protein
LNTNAQEKSVRGALGWGFFAEFLWVLNHIEFCIATDKDPSVYWGDHFAYYNPAGYEGKLNGWEYYFEPVSTAHYIKGDSLRTEMHYSRPFSTLWNYHQYLENRHLCTEEENKAFKKISNESFDHSLVYPDAGLHLYSEKFRTYVHEMIIKKFINVKPSIAKTIEDFYENNIKGKKTIAVHLRGRHIWGEVPFITVHDILKEANTCAGNDVQFFVATDQLPLIEQAKRELKGNVIYYECDRFAQTTSPIAGGKKLDPKLGEDILIEALLMARCDFFVHTISNVSTAVLYFNPTLKHLVLY